jgi:hypothetical protein
MTTRTRYFVVGSLLTLAVGLGVGLVAYWTGFSTSAFTRQGGPDELQFVPPNAALVAYADVRDIMLSDVRQRLRSAVPDRENGQHEFQERTGINIETDIAHVVAAVVPIPGEQTAHGPGSAIVLARGQFDQVKIESLMREHGAQVEDYKGTRLIVGETNGRSDLSVAFLEPGLVAVGGTPLVRGAVDLKAGGASIATNDEIMNLIADLDSGNAWAVGRFDALTSQARLPDGVAQQIPSINLFSASARVDSGISAVVRAETRDEEAANSLRDVVRGFLALGRLQASSRPEVATLIQSLQLGGTGKTVSLSFHLPSSALDLIQNLAVPNRDSVAPRQ